MTAIRIDRMACIAAALVVAAAALPCQAQQLEKLSVLVFSPPSLGAFMPPVIKAREARSCERARHHFPRAHARRLHRAVQFRRVQDRRQRLAADNRARRCPRRQGEISVQPVRFLGHGGHLASGDQDAQGSRRQAARRRPRDHQLRDVRVLRQEARRRRIEDPGREHGDAGPGRLCARQPRRRRAAVGAGLYAAALEEAGHPHARHQHRRHLEGVRRRQPHPLSRRRRPCGLGRANPALVAKLYATYKAAAEWISSNPDAAAPLVAPGASAADVQCHGVAHSQQRAARHEPRPRQRGPQGDRGGLQGRHRRRLFSKHAVEHHDLRQVDR